MILSLDAGQIRLAARSSKAGRRFSDAILLHAREMLVAPLLELEREEGRDVILPTSRKLVDRVATLAIADCLQGGSTHRKRAICELLNAATFPDWNPAHFLDTAEMTTGMALGLYWTRAILSHSEREVVAAAIIGKGLSPGLEAAAAGAPWLTLQNNWNIVCCAGMIAGAAAIDDLDNNLAGTVLDRFVPAIQHGLSAFGADGGYTEGPDYWEYAVRYAVFAQTILKDLGLGPETPAALLNTWRYGRDLTGPSGRVFNFGDATEEPRRAPVLGWLANRTGEPEAMAWQHAAPGDPHPFDLLWCAPDIETMTTGDEPVAYEPAGIAVLRKDTTWLAFKGGRNDVNHAHLDLGTFVLEMAGQRFAGELGRENYALPGYFDRERRFCYFRTQTAAHNTLLIDGAEQSIDAHTNLLGTGQEGENRFVAYEIFDGKRPSVWRRGVALASVGTVFIVDELEAGEGLSPRATWQVYTQAAVTLTGARAELALGDVMAEVEIQEPTGLVWSFEKAYSPASESSNAAFGRLFFDVPASVEARSITVKFALAGEAVAWKPVAIAGWPLSK